MRKDYYLETRFREWTKNLKTVLIKILFIIIIEINFYVIEINVFIIIIEINRNFSLWIYEIISLLRFVFPCDRRIYVFIRRIAREIHLRV